MRTEVGLGDQCGDRDGGGQALRRARGRAARAGVGWRRRAVRSAGTEGEAVWWRTHGGALGTIPQLAQVLERAAHASSVRLASDRTVMERHSTAPSTFFPENAGQVAARPVAVMAGAIMAATMVVTIAS